jgi:hypothetical protein
MPIVPIPLGLAGPLLDVGLSVPKAYVPWGGPPGTWKALIDTGADMTAISPNVVAALKPMQIGVQAVGRPGGGPVMCDTYDVRIRFGGHATPGRWFHLEAVEVPPATAGVDVLIGMELLLQIDRAWFGPRRLLFLSY